MILSESFNPIQDGPFFWLLTVGVGASKNAPSLISVTHPTMMKLGTVIPYLKNIKKVYESSALFHQRPEKFAISRNCIAF